jgi:hypothetical protein
VKDQASSSSIQRIAKRQIPKQAPCTCFGA